MESCNKIGKWFQLLQKKTHSEDEKIKGNETSLFMLKYYFYKNMCVHIIVLWSHDFKDEENKQEIVPAIQH